ncbi:MAG: hypothetical protein M3Y82_06990, partial [Verrucomicrobiota bacterium]|nr:hypothetical protein [Verrucomicrobiota bacterium]
MKKSLNLIAALVVIVFFAGCHSSSKMNSKTVNTKSDAPKTLQDFQAKATQFNSVLSVPELPTTPDIIKSSLTNVIATANAALDEIGQRDSNAVNFANTIKALDDVSYFASLTANKLSLTKETSTNAALRASATDAIKVFEEWSVGLDYREDVYAAVKAFAATQPKLSGEEEKLWKETMRDYRRAGLE